MLALTKGETKTASKPSKIWRFPICVHAWIGGMRIALCLTVLCAERCVSAQNMQKWAEFKPDHRRIQIVKEARKRRTLQPTEDPRMEHSRTLDARYWLRLTILSLALVGAYPTFAAPNDPTPTEPLDGQEGIGPFPRMAVHNRGPHDADIYQWAFYDTNFNTLFQIQSGDASNRCLADYPEAIALTKGSTYYYRARAHENGNDGNCNCWGPWSDYVILQNVDDNGFCGPQPHPQIPLLPESGSHVPVGATQFSAHNDWDGHPVSEYQYQAFLGEIPSSAPYSNLIETWTHRDATHTHSWLHDIPGGGTKISWRVRAKLDVNGGHVNWGPWAGDFFFLGTQPDILTNVNSVSIQEAGSSTFQVKLSAQPSANTTVSVTRSSGDSDISVSSGSSLVFNTSNWNTYQTATLTAAQDTDSANGTATISCTANGVTSKDITAAEVDDDLSATLGASLDNQSLTWTTTGSSAWQAQASQSHDGSDAAQSGDIADSQSSSLQVTVTGPTDITFWWKVSSEADFDFLAFFIDGIKIQEISGEQGWQKIIHSLTSGSHTIVWNYLKDGSASLGSDAGWVDQVTVGSTGIVVNRDTISIPEAGLAAFQVTLSGLPTTNVSVAVSRVAGDSDITVQTGSNLIFTPGNWNNYQSVTLAAAEDADSANGQATIRCSSPGLDSKDVSASEVDNDNQVSRHSADINADNRLVLDEMTAYGAAWKQGQTWQSPPNPIPLDYVTRAGYLWKSGECYSTLTGITPPLNWVSCSKNNGETSNIKIGIESSIVTRSISGLNLSIAVLPDPTTSAYAIEELLPAGLTPNSINLSGAWDSANRKVKWGPFFDATARTLTYSVTGTSGTYTVSGAVSLDGASHVIGGINQIVIPGVGTSTVVRSITGSNVSITATPASGKNSYALEEGLPAGLTPTNINQNGSWDSANRKVKWGPFFDATARTFTYAVTGGSGTYTVSGVASFDGVSQVIGGISQIVIGDSCNVVGVTPESGTVPFEGASRTFSIDVSLENCIWTASTTTSGIIIAPDPDTTGDGRIFVTVPQNPMDALRTIRVDVAIQGSATATRSVTITQSDSNPGPRRTLTLTPSPANGGSIGADPLPGIDGKYANGTVVNLTATANSGFSFSHWSGGRTGSANPTQVLVNPDTAVTATFTTVRRTLTLTPIPSNGGRIATNPAPGADGKYADGAVVILTAMTNSGFSFSSWSGGATGSANPVMVTVNADKAVIANFASAQPVGICCAGSKKVKSLGDFIEFYTGDMSLLGSVILAMFALSRLKRFGA